MKHELRRIIIHVIVSTERRRLDDVEYWPPPARVGSKLEFDSRFTMVMSWLPFDNSMISTRYRIFASLAVYFVEVLRVER